MSPEAFVNASKLISARNVSDNVLAITTSWRPETATLTVSYFTDRVPEDDDEEECEITCAELLAAFPEIRTAETRCVQANLSRAELAAMSDLAFLR